MAKTFFTAPRLTKKRRRTENFGADNTAGGASYNTGAKAASIPVRGDRENGGGTGSAAGTAPGANGGSAGGYDTGSFEDYYTRLISALHSYGISMSLPTLDELYAQLSAFLRPSVDAAIENRRRHGDTVMAELDADAYSRGMGGSSYLSSMKGREYDNIERDVAALETGYTSTLAEYLYNASQELAGIQAQFAAMQLQHQYDMQKLHAQQQYASGRYGSHGSGSGTGGSGSAGSESSGPALTEHDYEANYSAYDVYMQCISDEDRYRLFHSSEAKWAAIREDMLSCLTPEGYEMLRSLYDPSYTGPGHHGGRGQRPDGLAGVHTHD